MGVCPRTLTHMRLYREYYLIIVAPSLEKISDGPIL
jgi:hypothetical protein